MSDAPNDFQDLLRQARAGNEEAARAIVERYGKPILMIVRRRLNRQLRRLYDSTDFTQMVSADFFTRAIKERTFQHPQELVAFLDRLASNKLIDAHRRHLDSPTHDLHRERSLHDPDLRAERALADPRPDPAQTVSSFEEVTRVLVQLKAGDRRVAGLILDGARTQEAALELGVSERTIRRVRHKLLEVAGRRLADEEGRN